MLSRPIFCGNLSRITYRSVLNFREIERVYSRCLSRRHADEPKTEITRINASVRRRTYGVVGDGGMETMSDGRSPRTANNNIIIIISPIIGRGAMIIIIRFLPPNFRIFRGVRKARRTRFYSRGREINARFPAPNDGGFTFKRTRRPCGRDIAVGPELMEI